MLKYAMDGKNLKKNNVLMTNMYLLNTEPVLNIIHQET